MFLQATRLGSCRCELARDRRRRELLVEEPPEARRPVRLGDRVQPPPEQRLALVVDEHVGPPERMLDELEALRGDVWRLSRPTSTR